MRLVERRVRWMLVERVIIEVSVDMIGHGFDGLKPEGEKGSTLARDVMIP